MAVDLSNVSEEDIRELDVHARLELISKVWHTIFEEDDAPLSDDVIELLNERLAEFESNPDACRPWDEVLQEIRARR